MTENMHKIPETHHTADSDVYDSKMFSHLRNYGFRRSVKQAFGFYLSYLLVAVLVFNLLTFWTMIIFYVVAVLQNSDNVLQLVDLGEQIAYALNRILGIPYVATVAFLVADKRHILGSFLGSVFLVLTTLLALFYGPLLGLVPVSYLTTREDKSHIESNSSDALKTTVALISLLVAALIDSAVMSIGWGNYIGYADGFEYVIGSAMGGLGFSTIAASIVAGVYWITKRKKMSHFVATVWLVWATLCLLRIFVHFNGFPLYTFPG